MRSLRNSAVANLTPPSSSLPPSLPPSPQTVLAMGGGTHPSEVYEKFRGRQPKPDALLRHSGLATEGACAAATK